MLSGVFAQRDEMNLSDGISMKGFSQVKCANILMIKGPLGAFN